MALEAKYRLHATRVDRIAIVDRPAVPDAEVLVFKRFKDTGTDVLDKEKKGIKADLEKKVDNIDENSPEGIKQIDKSIPIVNFNADFLIRSTESAVDSLRMGFFNPLYYDSAVSVAELNSYWTELFAQFQVAIVDILKRQAKKINKKEGEQLLTTKEIETRYSNGLSIVTISEAFSHLRNTLSYLMFETDEMENAEEAITAIISIFKEFVTAQGATLIEKKKTDPQQFEKVGRKISSARLKELRKAVEVLTSIINEVEVSKNKEAEDMELEQLLKKLDELSVKVDGFTSELDLIKTAFKENDIPLTEAEKTARAEKIEAEKAEADAKIEAEKAEAEVAEKKASEEAVEAEKADLEKRRVALALEEGADKEAIEKAEKELLEKAENFKKDLPNKIEGIEKALGEFKKFVETVGKRFGIKTSIDVDVDKKTAGDPFGKVLRG